MARLAAAAVLAALPALAFGQAQPTPHAQANPAAEHLAAARAALNKVLNAPAPNGDAFKKLSEIKTEYIALERAASTAAPEWQTHYQTIDRLLNDLLGAPAASAETGAVGTSGRETALSPAVSANLMDFRTHLMAFGAAMKGGAPPAAAPAAATATASVAAPPASAAPPPATPPATPPAAPPATPPATDTAAPPAPSAMPATADATVIAQLDQVMAMIDGALKANAAQPTGTVSVERAQLEQMKAQLEQIRQSLKK